ncbi:hypothetical protein ScPMuIL_000904 [Solemya velum]
MGILHLDESSFRFAFFPTRRSLRTTTGMEAETTVGVSSICPQRTNPTGDVEFIGMRFRFDLGVEYGKDGEPLELECSGVVSADAVRWVKIGPPDQILASINSANPQYPKISTAYNITAGVYNIIITPFGVSDEGNYKCTLNKNGNISTPTLLKVKLAVAPTLGALTMEIDNAAPSTVVWVAGRTKSVSCECTDGGPAPTVTLYQDGTLLKTGTISVSSSITLTKTPTLTKVLKCIAENIVSAIEKTTRVTVKVPPTSITTKINGVDLETVDWVDGQTKTVTCEAVGGSPTPTVLLMRDSTVIEFGTGSISQYVTLTKSLNPAVIQCSATNIAIDNPMTDQTTVNLQYRPSNGPVITGLPSQDLIEERSPTTLTLTCTVGMSNPEPTLTWNCPAGNDSSNTRSITRTISVNKKINGDTCTCSGSQSVTGWTGIVSVTFTVHYLPNSGPDITGYVTGQKLTEAPSAKVTLTCIVGEADPQATIKWGSNCPAGADTSSTKSITRVISVHRRINGVTCTCSGSQSVTGWTGADSVTLTVYYGPDSVTIGGVERVYTGESLTLSCDTVANPGVTYRWMKNGGVVPGQTQQTLTSTYNRNDKTVSCTATNSITSTTATGSTPLTVDYGTSNTSIQVSEVTIEGETVTINCSSLGNPAPTYTITGPRRTSNQGTLEIADIDRSDSGQYSCTAVNPYNIETRTVDVEVQYPPDVSVTYTNVTKNDTGMVITCEVTGEPPTYNFSPWKHIGPDEHTEIRHLPGKQNGGQFALTFNDPITYEDSGYYTCIASNGIKGRSQQIKQTKMSGYFVVEGSPKVLTEDSEVRGNLGEDVILTVAFYSLPTFTSVQWFKQHQQASVLLKSNNSEYTIGTRVSDLKAKFHDKDVTVPGYITSVNYNNVTRGDFTSYTVLINNTEGSSVFTITLKGVSKFY